MSRHTKQQHKYSRKDKNRKRDKEGAKKKRLQRLIFRGIKYCNKLELRVAKLLYENNIKFEYSKDFATRREDGLDGHREVDFWLPEPIKIYWCTDPVQAIEVKGGKLDERCWFQRRELRNVGVKTFIALPPYVSFWENHGFLREKGLRKSVETKKKNKK